MLKCYADFSFRMGLILQADSYMVHSAVGTTQSMLVMGKKNKLFL